MTRLLTYLIPFVLLLSFSCRSEQKKEVDRTKFRYVTVPSQMPPQSQREYLREHFWDHFDFADSSSLHLLPREELMKAFVSYLRIIGPMDSLSMGRLIGYASFSKPMFDTFCSMADEVLHDPNSPLRSDELYIPVLAARVYSPYLDETEKLGPEYDLNIAMRNRIFHPAEDFVYTLESGRTGTLYGIKSDYVIVFINNPGCQMCMEIISALNSSEIIGEMIAKKQLTVLAIYPDRDLGEWRKHRKDMNPKWINAYDRECLIDQNGLYDLKAIPALYLLDADKRVVLKDSTSVPEIEQALSYGLKAQ